MKILLRGEESQDIVALLEDAVPPAWEGPPLHHHGWDEAFYVVLTGELTFQLADRVVAKRAGEVTFAPRDIHHTFANLSEAPAAYLLFWTPAGFEPSFDSGDRSWAPDDLPERFAVGPPLGSHVRRDETGA